MVKTPKRPASASASSGAAPVSPLPAGLEDYIVNEAAPSHVAGRRVEKGQTITLSEEQARGELLAQHIRPALAVKGSEDADK
ncbi:hypothetical protein [Agrobacterium sp. MS2]|uniref:hypothetical protein n=1 Tax=Agrobacterium sp. MS2 TaxID=1345498 RepID=UPI000DB78D25|nr:hypothetical protein [Agrobacterium sp. MS2]PZP72857.1 MAG: hypothetical protein DI604_13125 [Delftia acidovorans]RAL95605.1 hypothetical protein DOU54_20830 [Agrobacterium sp. MS2]